MYFKDFKPQDISTDIGKTFIIKLSDLLERLNPPLVDKERIKITFKIDHKEEYIKVYIPHKTKGILDLLIEHDEIDSTVELADADFNFQEYSDDNDRIEDVISLITKIMQTTIEVHSFYQGKKVTKRKPYFVSKKGEKEPFQVSFHNLLILINPFLIVRKVVERGSFFDE